MHITVRPNTYVYLVILLLMIPLPWLLAWLTAMIFHEFCHWLAVKLCGGNADSITVGIGGIDMRCGSLTDGKRLICMLSGPVSGFLLTVLGQWLPRVAVCGWLLSVYNLLPLWPLDGGKILQIILRNDVIFQIIQWFVLFLLTACAVYAAVFLEIGALPILVIVLLWLKIRKIPCNESVSKLQ